jgi:hypothetical protein
LASTGIAPAGPGAPSPPSAYSFRSANAGAQSSSTLVFEKDASSAPATVPVASSGASGAGDHANVLVRWISLSFMGGRRTCRKMWARGKVCSRISLDAGPRGIYTRLYTWSEGHYKLEYNVDVYTRFT